MRAMLRIAVAAGVLVSGACSEARRDASHSTTVPPEEGLHYLTGAFRGVAEFVQRAAPFYRTLDELLPNVEYVYPDGRTRRLTDLAVVGRFVRLEKGAGFVVDGGDGPNGVPVDFDDPDSKWRTVHAIVEVDHGVGGTDAPEELKVSLPLWNKEGFEKYDAGLRALGRVVLFLERNSPLAEYDRSAYVVAQNHVFIAKVDTDGALSLPLVGEDEAASLLAPTVRNLADLERAATTPRRIALTPGPHPDLPMRGAG